MNLVPHNRGRIGHHRFHALSRNQRSTRDDENEDCAITRCERSGVRVSGWNAASWIYALTGRSITGLIGGAMDLSGHRLKAGTTSCDGLGLVLVAVLWTRELCDDDKESTEYGTEHLWTLALASATFMILIHVGFATVQSEAELMPLSPYIT